MSHLGELELSCRNEYRIFGAQVNATGSRLLITILATLHRGDGDLSRVDLTRHGMARLESSRCRESRRVAAGLASPSSQVTSSSRLLLFLFLTRSRILFRFFASSRFLLEIPRRLKCLSLDVDLQIRFQR